MTDYAEPVTGLKILTDTLAELDHKLRLSLPPPIHDTLLPPDLPPLKIAAGLLGELGREAAGHGYARCGVALSRLIATWEAAPAGFNSALEPALQSLSVWLEDLFGLLDAGQSPRDLAGHGRWLLLAEALKQAGTCLSVFAELENTLLGWEAAWSERDLDAHTEQRLHQRWSALRRYADALFLDGAPVPESLAAPGPVGPEAVATPVTIQLLVDSSFRRSQIQEILTAAGYPVEVVPDVDAAVGACLVRPGCAIVCDNLEPSNHLLKVRQALQTVSGADRTPVILITSTGAASAPDDRDRARRMGATGLWREPFHPVDLREFL